MTTLPNATKTLLVGQARHGQASKDLTAAESAEFAQTLRGLEVTMKQHMALLTTSKLGGAVPSTPLPPKGELRLSLPATARGKKSATVKDNQLGGEQVTSTGGVGGVSVTGGSVRRESTKPTDNQPPTRSGKVCAVDQGTNLQGGPTFYVIFLETKKENVEFVTLNLLNIS